MYHLDRFPGNSSTHSPIFATIEYDQIRTTECVKEGGTEGPDNAFNTYLSRKRPNWDNIDMELFHKLSNIKM